MQRINILGIPVDTLTARDALMEIGSFFTREGQHHIATPNPEMIVEAQRNREFRDVLQKTDLNVPDGVGILWAAKHVARASRPRSAGKVPAPQLERVTGTDTLIALCSLESRICPPERVFLLGAAPGVAEHAAEALREQHPNLPIVGTCSGSPREDEEDTIIERINAASPTLLFVAFGAPAQDLWIARNLKKLRTVKVAMGVGGAFDFLAGKQKRAPVFLRGVGLEWLWRLLWEPWRLKRIWKAVVVFPWMVRRERTRTAIRNES